jgi:hypothetical protein
MGIRIRTIFPDPEFSLTDPTPAPTLTVYIYTCLVTLTFNHPREKSLPFYEKNNKCKCDFLIDFLFQKYVQTEAEAVIIYLVGSASRAANITNSDPDLVICRCLCVLNRNPLVPGTIFWNKFS